MKRYKILASVTLALGFASCGEDFFDLAPVTDVSTDLVYKTAGDFNTAVMGCYAKMQDQVGFYTECCEYRSDNLFLSAPTTGTQDRYDIDQFQDVPSNGILSDYWANFNNGVYRCNMILDRIDGADFDQTLKMQYKGEALFIRAYTYFNMYRAWGGVPTTRKVVTAAEGRLIGRSSDQQMYDLIAGDLESILDEEMLPETYTADDLGRVTSGAVKSLLGKVYLTFGRWSEARDVLSEVVGKYTLLTNPGDVFSVDNKMNTEIIFAIRFNKTVVNEGHGFWFSQTSVTGNTPIGQALYDCYDDPADTRRALIDYVQVESGVAVMNKFYDTRDATTLQVGNDQILLRYADVLLMYAEALNEISYSDQQDSPALNALNLVHTRSVPTAIQISALPDQEAFRSAILLERQREFPFEGQRWFDLVRMGGAIDAMAADGHVINQNNLLFPIPQTELERINNTSILWQNPGY